MKLYWRLKRNGKWTWTAAEVLFDNSFSTTITVAKRKEEE